MSAWGLHGTCGICRAPARLHVVRPWWVGHFGLISISGGRHSGEAESQSAHLNALSGSTAFRCCSRCVVVAVEAAFDIDNSFGASGR